MSDILFSSWGGVVTDNRGKPEAERQTAPGLNLPLEFDKERKIRAFVGWDGIAIRDPEVNIVDMIRAYLEAVQKESCGKCTPCRVGTRIMSSMMNRIAAGQGRHEDLDQLRSLGESILQSSKCNLGQTGPKPVLEALSHFKGEFSEAIDEKRVVPRQEYKIKVTAPCISSCPSVMTTNLSSSPVPINVGVAPEPGPRRIPPNPSPASYSAAHPSPASSVVSPLPVHWTRYIILLVTT